GDADDLAAGIQERSPGVAGIDGRIGLDGLVNESALSLQRADRADDAAGHGSAEAEWIADGIDLLPDYEVLGISDLGLGHGLGWDLNHGQIVNRVSADDLRPVFLLIARGDFKLTGAFDNVEIRQDVPFAVNHKTRSHTLLGHGAVKEIKRDRGGGNVHDR